MSEESPPPRQFAVERVRKASVWSEHTLLECTEDEEFVLFTLTQDAHSLSIRLTVSGDLKLYQYRRFENGRFSSWHPWKKVVF